MRCLLNPVNIGSHFVLSLFVQSSSDSSNVFQTSKRQSWGPLAHGQRAWDPSENKEFSIRCSVESQGSKLTTHLWGFLFDCFVHFCPKQTEMKWACAILQNSTAFNLDGITDSLGFTSDYLLCYIFEAIFSVNPTISTRPWLLWNLPLTSVVLF